MDRQVDIMGFAPASDLTSLGKAANNTEIDPGVVDPLLLDQLAELPLRAELLTSSQRHTGSWAQCLEQFGFSLRSGSSIK